MKPYYEINTAEIINFFISDVIDGLIKNSQLLTIEFVNMVVNNEQNATQLLLVDFTMLHEYDLKMINERLSEWCDENLGEEWSLEFVFGNWKFALELLEVSSEE